MCRTAGPSVPVARLPERTLADAGGPVKTLAAETGVQYDGTVTGKRFLRGPTGNARQGFVSRMASTIVPRCFSVCTHCSRCVRCRLS